MPTYEYIREDGTRFDIIQKFSDAPLTVCPDTGLTVKRIISGGSGVIYKGSGWYVTDYKNNSSDSEKVTSDTGVKSKSEESTTTVNKSDTGNSSASDNSNNQS